MSRILIVEDEEKIARFLELELIHEGYETEKAPDGRTGLDLAQSGRFDLIILDIMLPYLSGIEVLRRLRKSGLSAADTPVILLTARDSVTDKVSGLDTGANDYVTKPFEIEELLARIRVLLRFRPAMPGNTEKSDFLECCGVRLNPNSREVTYLGNPVELTNREFVLLKTLLENRNVVMSREKLLCEAWGYDYFGETNIIDVYVRYIRHKTSDDVIKTIRGVGYLISDGEES